MNKKIRDIAKRELGINNLKSQNSDALDFHEHSVWNIENALAAAYNAGQENKK